MSKKASFYTYQACKTKELLSYFIKSEQFIQTDPSSLLLIKSHPSVILACLKLWDMNFLSFVQKMKNNKLSVLCGDLCPF